MKIFINAATGGALTGKPINDAEQLFEDMHYNNLGFQRHLLGGI